MSTIFPTGLDLFANPNTIKVDGVDVVQAAHVNDLEDAVQALENFSITPGSGPTWAGSPITTGTCLVTAIGNNATGVAAGVTALATHIAATASQHVASAIIVTPGGNLTATDAQTAFGDFQEAINNIMDGGTNYGVTLDDRYVQFSSSPTFTGNVDVTGTLTVGGNSTFGTTGANSLSLTGTLNVSNSIYLSGGNFVIPKTSLIGLGDAYSYFGFTNVSNPNTVVSSKHGIVLQLDADNLVENDSLYLLSGTGATILQVTEAGVATLGGVTSSLGLTTVNATNVNAANLALSNQLVASTNDIVQIDIDHNNTGSGERFVVTMKGNNGASLSSTNLLLNVDASSNLTTGIHLLKSGIQETGYLGLRTYSPAPGSIFFGQGVNFKTQMTNSPSSITLSIGTNVNATSISVVSVNQYGFAWECASVATGDTQVFGTYTTVGN